MNSYSLEQLESARDRIGNEVRPEIRELLNKSIVEKSEGKGFLGTGYNVNLGALGAKGALSAPSTVVPIGLSFVNPALGVTSGFTVAMGSAKQEADSTIDQAFKEGDLQKTKEYQDALESINNMGLALSSSEKEQRAVQLMKNNINPNLLPAGAIGSLQAILPSVKIPFIPRIVSAGVGEAGAEVAELELVDKAKRDVAGLGEDYMTPTSQKVDEGILAGIFGGAASVPSTLATGVDTKKRQQKKNNG